MLQGVQRLFTSGAARVSITIQCMLVLAEGFVLARPQTGEQNLVCAGGDPVLLLLRFAFVGFIWPRMREGFVNYFQVDERAGTAEGDGSGDSLDGGCCFGGCVSEFITRDVGMAGHPLDNDGAWNAG